MLMMGYSEDDDALPRQRKYFIPRVSVRAHQEPQIIIIIIIIIHPSSHTARRRRSKLKDL
jgi:hypothetical protein